MEGERERPAEFAVFVGERIRQRVNVIKAREGYKTQGAVIEAALDKLEESFETKEGPTNGR